MLVTLLICGSITVGVIAALATAVLDGFDGSLSLLAGICGAAIAMIVGLVIIDSALAKNRDKAKQEASKKCSPYQARIFVDEEKKTVVFSCANNPQLQVIKYKN